MRTRIPLIDDCRALSVAVPEAPSPSELPESDVPVSLARGKLCVGVTKVALELVDESIFALDPSPPPRTELCVGVTKVAPELLDESPLALDPSPLPELLATHVKLGTVCPAEPQF